MPIDQDTALPVDSWKFCPTSTKSDPSMAREPKSSSKYQSGELSHSTQEADFTDSHYDVTIDPHIKVVNQKKPKALMRAVWEQLVIDQVAGSGDWAESFSASVFDGRKNAYSPIPFLMRNGQFLGLSRRHGCELIYIVESRFTTAIDRDGVVRRPGQTASDDEARRWDVTIKHVATIDLQAVMDFCGNKGNIFKVEEECLTGE